MKKERWKKALRLTIPVMTGYLVLGMGFGVIMSANGYGPLLSVAMSLTVYAGSMQYAAVGLFTGGASLLTAALTTLAVNARHLLYGISMIGKYREAGNKKWYLFFSLTDETYSLVSSEETGPEDWLPISLLDHVYWVTGTALGALIGNFVPFPTEGIDFALTALFITIFTGQWMGTREHIPALSGVLVSVVCLLLFGPDRFLIPSMIGISLALLLYGARKEKGGDADERN